MDERLENVQNMMRLMALLFPEQVWWKEAGARALALLRDEGVPNVPTLEEVIRDVVEAQETARRAMHDQARAAMAKMVEDFGEVDWESLRNTDWYRRVKESGGP